MDKLQKIEVEFGTYGVILLSSDAKWLIDEVKSLRGENLKLSKKIQKLNDKLYPDIF